MAELISIEDKYQNRFNRTVTGTLPGDQGAQTNNTPDIDQTYHRLSVKTDNADIRLSFGLFYLVIMFGKEQRSGERLAEDREKHPILTRAPAMLPRCVAIFSRSTKTVTVLFFQLSRLYATVTAAPKALINANTRSKKWVEELMIRIFTHSKIIPS